MRRATAVSGVEKNSLLPSARAPTGDCSRGRNGGLFSSSSSSSGESDASNSKDSSKERLGAMPPLLGATARSRFSNPLSSSFSNGDFQRHTMFSTSATSLSSSTIKGDTGGQSAERKGLFETDDDVVDSLETFHERVKLRQSKKQLELKALNEQLEAAQQRAIELKSRLIEANTEKEECVLRTKECQRIIDKRNKQLIKASEKMAQHSEQYELQILELQTKLATITTQCEQLRADAIVAEHIIRRERELKDQERLHGFEVLTQKHEEILEATETRLREQQAANAVVAEKLRQVERQLVETAHQQPTTAQIVACEEYQTLVKRCESAEEISRGLNFQLAREQHEKKYLRKQLTALQEIVGTKTAAATAASVGYLPDLLLEPNNGASNRRDSDAAETKMVDSAPKHESAMYRPIAAPALPEVSSLTCDSVSSSRRQSRLRRLSTSGCADDGPKMSMRDGKRRAASVQMSKTTLDPPDKLVDDKSAQAIGKSSSSSVTFFEKLSSRFKRSLSPRNVMNSAKDEDDNVEEVATSVGGLTSPLAQRQGLTHGKVLKERPRMYVAKSPSDHEDESSDSIFGSESSLSDLSEEDMPPLPPPPPMFVHAASPLMNASVHMTMPAHLDSPTDADASSSRISDNSDHEGDEWRDAFDEPMQLPTRFGDPLEIQEQVEIPPVPSAVRKASLSSSSLSPSSDNESDEHDMEESQFLNVDTKKTDSRSDISSPSDSPFTDEDNSTVKNKNEVHKMVQNASLLDLDRPKKRLSRSPPPFQSHEMRKIYGGGDDLYSTSKSRMNEYMEDRARKRNEKLKRKEDKEHEETIKKEEYEKEWEKMAQEERERKRKQQQARRSGKRRPASMKTVRVSQMRQQLNSKQHKEQKEFPTFSPSGSNHPLRPHGDVSMDVDCQSRDVSPRNSENKTSESEAEEEQTPLTESPPLPPEPTLANTELYLRQQARLRERHETQMKKKLEADEADAVRGDIHRRVEMWAFGKELLHLILTLDQISSNDALKKCQLMVVQSPDDDTVRKAYRSIIRVVHPDKFRGATISEQLEAKELFTVLNQSFEKFKNQARVCN